VSRPISAKSPASKPRITHMLQTRMRRYTRIAVGFTHSVGFRRRFCRFRSHGAVLCQFRPARPFGEIPGPGPDIYRCADSAGRHEIRACQRGANEGPRAGWCSQGGDAHEMALLRTVATRIQVLNCVV
jgi:hypothetical protein